MEIRVQGNDVERALKTLKTRLQKEGLFREIKKRKYYDKPSVKRKKKQAEARKRKAKSFKFSSR